MLKAIAKLSILLFPKRVQLGPNRVGWVEAEVLEWLEARLANRDTPPDTPD